MQIGKMNKLITIMKITTSKGDTGQHIETPSKYKTAWSYMYFDNGNETFESNKETAINRVKFFIRYTTGITEQMRVYYDSNYYDITHIEETNNKQYLILKAVKKV
jgi:SPP1 family predicted phage head-tail adaptor